MSSVNRATSPVSLSELASERARGLCLAAGLGTRADELSRICERMMLPWGRAPLASRPEWVSHVVDDGTPFEFSLAFGNLPEVRFLVEPLAPTPSLGANIRAARDLLTALAPEFELDLSRFDLVSDLFLPRSPTGVLGIWLAVAISEGAAPSFKLYLNPQASGPSRAPLIIEEALVRLGFERSWPVVGNVLTKRGPILDELKYFALDLSRTPDARVKVYARHHDSTAEVLTSAAAGCPTSPTANLRRFLAAVSPDRAQFDSRGPFTCYAFVSGNPKPDSVTTHFPINGYAPNDDVAAQRVLAAMRVFGVPTRPFEDTLRTIANRPLEDGIGYISYVSFRQHQGETRLTTYLPREVYAPGTIESVGGSRRASGVTERLGQFPGLSIEHHPFASRLAREPDGIVPLLRFVQSVDVAVDGVAHELRELIPQVEAGSPVAELMQLFVDRPELVPQNTWLSNALRMLLPMRPTAIDTRALLAGRRFRDRLRNYHQSADAYARVGAAFATVMFGNAACAIVNTRMRERTDSVRDASDRLPTLPGPIVTPWTLAACVREEPRETVFAGINECSKLAWAFLNDLYAVCY
jgi:DMATS type aromatic prenyltransferase